MRDPEDPWQDEIAASLPTPAIGPTETELKRQAITNCDICDNDGYDGTRVCQHPNENPAQTAARHTAAIRRQMGWKPTPGTTTPT